MKMLHFRHCKKKNTRAGPAALHPHPTASAFGLLGLDGGPPSGVTRITRGFSLIEIIIAITIGSLLTFILGDLIVRGYKTYAITADQTTQIAIARRTQDTIIRELREATVGDNGDYPLITAEANLLAFYSDVDRDTARERIRYWREEKLVKRGATEPTGTPTKYQDADETVRTIAHYLDGNAPLFRYYDATGKELAPPLDVTAVTQVRVAFTIDAAPGKLPRGTEVGTTVQLRNIQASLE